MLGAHGHDDALNRKEKGQFASRTISCTMLVLDVSYAPMQLSARALYHAFKQSELCI